MLESLLSLLTFGMILLAAFGLGRPVVRTLCTGEVDPLAIAVWSVVLGLVLGGTLLAGLGLAGLLHAPLVGLITVCACFWAAAELICAMYRRLDTEMKPFVIGADVVDEAATTPWSPPARWLLRGALGLAALACLGSLVGALAPPTAGDALCYHLQLPKVFLAEHAVVHVPYSENSTYPLLVEMWYLWGLALEGPVTAQLMHWGAGVLLALAAVVLATPIVGRPWAWIAGAVVVLVPGVNNQMTAPLNDVALALLTTMTLIAWRRAVADDAGPRWFVAAGLAAGGALATKYIAVLFALAVGVTWVWMLWQRPRQRRAAVRGAAVVTVVAVSVAGLWYVRAAWYRGNPVYPFFNEVLAAGDDGNDHQTLPASKAPLGRNLASLPTAAWHATIEPGRFGGRGHQLGVLFLAAVPGLLFTRRLRGLGTLLAVAVAYFVLWHFLRQNVRFLYPVVPLLAVAVVWVLIEMQRFAPRPRTVALAALAGILVLYAAVPVLRSRDKLAVALGRETREQFLLRSEPSYPAAAVANCLLPGDAHLLSQDYRGFYFDCRVTREAVYRRRTGYDRRVAEPADLAPVLQADGFTHLLLVETVDGPGIRFDATLSRLADAAMAEGDGERFEALAQYDIADTDGALRRYRLVALR